MNGFSGHFGENGGSKRRTLPLATVLCLALLALLAVVQVAHMHPFDKDADHCQLCIAMQSAAPVAVFAAAVVLVQVGTSAPLFEPLAVVRHRHPKLYTRPPPASC